MQLDVQLCFEDFEEAVAASQRVWAEQARRARLPWRTLIVFAASMLVSAAVVLLAVFSGVDSYSQIRPAAYVLICIALPVLAWASAAAIVNAPSTSLWRSLGWMLLLLGSLVFVFWHEARSPALARARPAPDWFGTFFPHLCWLLVVAYLTWLMFAARRSQTRKLWDLQPNLLRPRSYQIDGGGVRVEENVQTRNYSWQAFRRFTETENVLLLWTSDAGFEIVPKRSFVSPKLLEAARALFLERITEAQPIPMAFEVLLATQPKG